MASGGAGLLTRRPQQLQAGKDLGPNLAASLLGRGNSGPGTPALTGPKPSGGVTPKPAGKAAGKGNKGGKAAPPFNPLTSTFGLNVNSNAPFDPLNAGASTVGGFNKQVLAAAQPQYLPQLQDIQGQMTAENTANQQRVADLGSIYSQYQQQAQDAYAAVQKALAGLAAETGAGSNEANLSAALGSALGGENNLAQMMGQTVPAGQSGVAPYLAAAQSGQSATADELNSAGSAALGLQGENLANVGNERATELNTESLRHQGAAQGLRQQQGALVEQIPGIIEKARQQLLSDMQSAQSLRFQEGLASQQFGLQAQAQGFNQAQTRAQFAETQKNDASNRAAQAATIQQNARALGIQQQSTNAAAQQAIAKAQGQSQVNAIKWLQSWLAPSSQEVTTKTVTDPTTGQKTTQRVLANPKAWHRDVGSALRSIMTLYGLPLNEALSLMEGVGGSTFVSGQGGQTIANWAANFRQSQITRAAAQAQRTKQQKNTPGINQNLGAGLG